MGTLEDFKAEYPNASDDVIERLKKALGMAAPDVFKETGRLLAEFQRNFNGNSQTSHAKPSKYRNQRTEKHIIAMFDSSEDSLLRYIIHLAHVFGWLAAHFRPAMTQRGQWVTAVAGDGAGFPDLVLVHPLFRGALFVECKSQKGKLSPAQAHWREWLEKAGCTYRLWRPSDRPEIEKTLRIE